MPPSLAILAISSWPLRFAEFRKARREHHCGAHLAPHTGFQRFLHAGSRQRKDREIDALRQFVDGCVSTLRPSISPPLRPTR